MLNVRFLCWLRKSCFRFVDQDPFAFLESAVVGKSFGAKTGVATFVETVVKGLVCKGLGFVGSRVVAFVETVGEAFGAILSTVYISIYTIYRVFPKSLYLNFHDI